MISLKHALIISSALALIATFGYVNYLRGEVKSLKAENSRMDEQLEIATLEINQCSKDKALSERVSNDYQKSASSLRNQLNSLRNNPHCISIEPTSPPNGDNGATPEGKLSGTNGLRAGYLLDFAGDAEETRLKLIGCQNFVNQLYEDRNGQN